jgi:hypothetical protein
VQQWLARRPRFHVHFTPTGSSWINQVERWFGYLTDKKIRRGVHKSVQAFEADIRAWIEPWNENPRPFAWTKTARRSSPLWPNMLRVEHIGIRLHEAILYNSLYRADDQLFVNQHAYGIPAGHSPVFSYRKSESGDLTAAYLDSFQKVRRAATPPNRPHLRTLVSICDKIPLSTDTKSRLQTRATTGFSPAEAA